MLSIDDLFKGRHFDREITSFRSYLIGARSGGGLRASLRARNVRRIKDTAKMVTAGVQGASHTFVPPAIPPPEGSGKRPAFSRSCCNN